MKIKHYKCQVHNEVLYILHFSINKNTEKAFTDGEQKTKQDIALLFVSWMFSENSRTAYVHTYLETLHANVTDIFTVRLCDKSLYVYVTV